MSNWLVTYDEYVCRRDLSRGTYTLEHINWWVSHHAWTPRRLALAA